MNNSESRLIHSGLTDQILHCFYGVFNELGFGFLESVYHEAMVIALKEAGLSVDSRVRIPVSFRGRQIGQFEADLLVEQRVILELKTTQSIAASHEAQLLNYLKATDIEVGFVLNFGSSPSFKRLYFDNSRKRLRPQIVER